MEKKKKYIKNKTKQRIFIILMLIYPVTQFILFFGYVNFDTILLTFQKFSFEQGGNIFAGFSNYKQIFTEFATDKWVQRTLINSLTYMPINSFVILPLSTLFSYFLYKKIPLSGFFRIIYFLPSILPIVVMTMAFSFIFDSNLGPINTIYKAIASLFVENPIVPSWFGKYPNNQYMIFLYCIWVGLGFNIILITGAITRIPKELIEYGEMEGAGFFTEFFKIVIPLIWPTIVTTFVLGVTAVFTVLLHPLLLTENTLETNTIALRIYNSVLNGKNIPQAATFGVVVSLMGLPIILIIRKFLSSFYKEVEY